MSESIGTQRNARFMLDIGRKLDTPRFWSWVTAASVTFVGAILLFSRP